MKYLLTGGGTGGHVYPALAIADELGRRQAEAQFLYVGRSDKLESWVVPNRGYPIRFVRSRPFPRSRSPWPLLAFGLVLIWGVLQSSLLLLRFRPDVIIGTGGYVSAPILFAHGLLQKIGLSRARVFLYEPNAHPGMLNQVVGRLAHRIGIAFEEAARWFDMKRVSVVGYPVRREFLEADRAEARRALKVDIDQKVLLVFGGSGGARVLNEALVQALPYLRERGNLCVVHITGKHQSSAYDAVADTRAAVEALGIPDVESWYRPVEYMDNIHQALAAADLVLCRAGAGTLTELGIVGRPALIVPLPTAAEDHQAANAREMEKVGAAEVLYQRARWKGGQIESALDGSALAERVLALLGDEVRLEDMAIAAAAVPRRNSLTLIVEEIDQIAAERRGSSPNLEFPLRQGGPPTEANALLRWVRACVDKAGGIGGLPERDLAYMRYQADRLLVSRGWCEIPLGRRNVGIKLVGLLDYQAQRDLLIDLLSDRTPVAALPRLMGGDYYHGGILRRNAIEWGVRLLGVADNRTRDVLQRALVEDPYFEVRAAAARMLGQCEVCNAATEQALIQALDDASPAVVVEALGALGQVAKSSEFLSEMKPFYQHVNWQFRQGVVSALAKGIERGVLAPDEVAHEIEHILTSSPHFKPTFDLNESLSALARQIEAEGESPSRDTTIV